MAEEVRFNSWDSGCKSPFGAVKRGTQVTFSLFLSKTVPQQAVDFLVFPIDHPAETKRIKMCLVSAHMAENQYQCCFTPEAVGVYLYSFELSREDLMIPIKRMDASQAGLGQGAYWQLTVYHEQMERPKALGNGIYYQIFPDRFCKSGQEKIGVPADRWLRQDWGSLPAWRADDTGEVRNNDYFGGDLLGIGEQLSYLNQLGVSAIYLNPIFEAHSNHRYNTADYCKIDPLLGTEAEFKTLCTKAADLGIAIILDGVFSHTGSDSVYFNKEGRYGEEVGAYRDAVSLYRPWYQFSHYPDRYEAWWGFQSLPNTLEMEPSFLRFICGKEGILEKWLDAGASGYRLDVADELPDGFLEALYACVKGKKEDAVVIGEVWEDASIKESYGHRRRYLLGEQMDSVMNYPFREAILDYVRDGGGSLFLTRVMPILENYPPPVLGALMNSLSTHDTPRAITVLAGERLADHDRLWQENHHYLPLSQYELGKKRLLLAALLQYGLPGMPCLYYGDEVGLSGYKDPFNRVCYPWGYEDGSLLVAFQALGRIRKEYSLFIDAPLVPLVFEDNFCAFLRQKDGEHILFAMNRGEVSVEFTSFVSPHATLLYATDSLVNFVLEPLNGAIYYWKEKEH